MDECPAIDFDASLSEKTPRESGAKLAEKAQKDGILGPKRGKNCGLCLPISQ
jgi:hypothetical protein